MGWWLSALRKVETHSPDLHRATRTSRAAARNISASPSPDDPGADTRERTNAASKFAYYIPESPGTMIVDADHEVPPEILSRLTNGEFVLEYEFPTARVGLSNHVAVNVGAYRTVIDREYDALFQDLGLGESVAGKAKNHLASIQRARVEAEAYLIQLDDAKLAYDEQMKQVLGPEQYLKYRETESARPAMRELSRIKDFLQQAEGFELTTPEETSLLEALKRSKRIPVYDGPYGEGAHASAGHDKVLTSLKQEMSLLLTESADLATNFSATGASDVLRSKVSDYYTERVRKKQEEIDRVATGP